MKQRFNFNVTSIEKCIESFKKAKQLMSIWEWERGGYEALYNSQLNRLKKEQEQREQKTKKK